MKKPHFLTLAEVIEIHQNQIHLYGGQSGVRDFHLLQSALSQPEATYAGESLHKDLFEMAAAYIFHICKNHPFIDGNKRAALATGLVFLEINGISLIDPDETLADVILNLIKGTVSKENLSEILRSLPLE